MLKLKNISSDPVSIYDIGLDPIQPNSVIDLEYHGVTFEEVEVSEDVNNGLVNGTLQVISDEATYSEPFNSPASQSISKFKSMENIVNLYYSGTINKGATKPFYNERTVYSYAIPLLFPISYKIQYISLVFSYVTTDTSNRANQNIPLEVRFYKYTQSTTFDTRHFSPSPSTTPLHSIDIPNAKEFTLMKLSSPFTLEHSTGYKVYIKNKTTISSNTQKIKRVLLKLYGEPVSVMSNDFYANFQ